MLSCRLIYIAATLTLFGLISCKSMSFDFTCNLCQHQIVIILGTGRSGSTTLLGMLNQLRNFDLGGEHYGYLIDLLSMKNKIEATNRYKGGAWTHSNYAVSSDQFLCWVQSWVILHSGWRPEPDIHRVHGFKEIRYHDEKVLEFLLQVFPCAKFVLNYRKDTTAQMNSAFMKEISDPNHAQNITNSLLAFGKRHSSVTYLMALEEFQDLNAWNSLFSWLGRGNCIARGVLHFNANNSYDLDERSAVECH